MIYPAGTLGRRGKIKEREFQPGAGLEGFFWPHNRTQRGTEKSKKKKTLIMFWKKTQKEISISVTPTNYRRIALRAIEECSNPVVWMDSACVDDFSENGPLVQKQIRQCIDFVIKDGDSIVLSFHDHPNEMLISAKYRSLADHCHENGWLKLEF